MASEPNILLLLLLISSRSFFFPSSKWNILKIQSFLLLIEFIQYHVYSLSNKLCLCLKLAFKYAFLPFQVILSSRTSQLAVKVFFFSFDFCSHGNNLQFAILGLSSQELWKGWSSARNMCWFKASRMSSLWYKLRVLCSVRFPAGKLSFIYLFPVLDLTIRCHFKYPLKGFTSKMSLFYVLSYFLDVDCVSTYKRQFYYRISGVPLKFWHCVSRMLMWLHFYGWQKANDSWWKRKKGGQGTGGLIWNRCWSFLPRISNVTVNKWSSRRKAQS